jgi:hypothetical protein
MTYSLSNRLPRTNALLALRERNLIVPVQTIDNLSRYGMCHVDRSQSRPQRLPRIAKEFARTCVLQTQVASLFLCNRDIFEISDPTAKLSVGQCFSFQHIQRILNWPYVRIRSTTSRRPAPRQHMLCRKLLARKEKSPEVVWTAQWHVRKI